MRTTAPISIIRNGWEYVRLPLNDGGIIEINQDVQWGCPVIRGTRIPAESIAGKHEAGDSIEVLCNLYSITEEQAKACINYVGAPLKGPIPFHAGGGVRFNQGEGFVEAEEEIGRRNAVERGARDT